MSDQTSTTWADPNPPSPTDPRAKPVLTIAGAVLTFVVLVTLVVVVIAQRGTIFGNSNGDLVLIAANTPGSQPFTPPMVVARPPVSEQAAKAIQTITQQLPASPDRGVRLVSGAHPGLYGGHNDGNACDAAAIANFLDGHPDKSTAWAKAIGIRPLQIPYYLNTLTPVVLTTDTWVSMHRYSGAEAVPTQAVLQAGNAVMVDPAGVPRLQCASGDPLGPPADDKLEQLPPVGQAWPGYELQNVVAVAYTDAPASFTDPVPTAPLGELQLVNLDTGEVLVRQVGGTIALPGSPTVALPDPIAMNTPPGGERSHR